MWGHLDYTYLGAEIGVNFTCQRLDCTALNCQYTGQKTWDGVSLLRQKVCTAVPAHIWQRVEVTGNSRDGLVD
jgi:hypothetical protein